MESRRFCILCILKIIANWKFIVCNLSAAAADTFFIGVVACERANFGRFRDKKNLILRTEKIAGNILLLIHYYYIFVATFETSLNLI